MTEIRWTSVWKWADKEMGKEVRINQELLGFSVFGKESLD